MKKAGFILLIIIFITAMISIPALQWYNDKRNCEENTEKLRKYNESYVRELYYADSLLREYQAAYKDCSEFNDKLVNYLNIMIDNEAKRKRNKKADQFKKNRFEEKLPGPEIYKR